MSNGDIDKEMLRLGYNTNGFACHTLESSLQIISKLGYAGVAITLDNYILNPMDPDLEKKLVTVKELLNRYSLSCVIETGARFLLNPWHKHEPTLISSSADARKARLEFLKRALYVAAKLDAESLSFWSGKKQCDKDDNRAWEWLISGCQELSNFAEEYSIPLAFEPEPGMFLENLLQYQKLRKRVNSDIFGLTLDVGHAFLTEEITVGECIRKFSHDIKNIHIEDMQKRIHQHLFFGQGEIDFMDIFKALKEIGYQGLINVELSRHSHNAVEVADQAIVFLRKFL
ncbi:MAG: sugar phosphate isomerase/epimerase [Deltaproteobacteria bacterium]|nr:MAG: sugar phosphate isomerase/epimerase [Deltaproteobacteria bacterium]